MSTRFILAESGVSGTTRPFSFPHEVVDDPSLSLGQKREILSEWASDACAVPSFPTLRLLPGTSFPVTFSAIMDARDRLDRHACRHMDAMGEMGVVMPFPGSRGQEKH